MKSNGLVVDHTPPDVIYVTTRDNAPYQQHNDSLSFIWDFNDPESNVTEYRCVVTRRHEGTVTDNFWPGGQDFHTLSLNASDDTAARLDLDLWDLGGSPLQDGASYSVRVTAVNRANMAASEESNSVVVDTSPPQIQRVCLWVCLDCC